LLYGNPHKNALVNREKIRNKESKHIPPQWVALPKKSWFGAATLTKGRMAVLRGLKPHAPVPCFV
jgi:hypothetical protein